jgi:hypothetical protein
MKIYDCFIFNNELDLLEVRLRETFDKVDRYVIVESNITFTGQPKPMHLHDNWQRFLPWADKITLLQAQGVHADNSAWANEARSRESLAPGIADADAEDYVLLSDADELFRASTFDLMRQHNKSAYGFRLPYFTFKLNYLQLRPYPRPWWPAGSAVRKNQLTTFESLRNSREVIGHKEGAIIGHAGWHFNNIGSDSEIREKLSSFSHTEMNVPAVLERLDVEQLVARGEGLLPGGEFTAVAFDEYFPASMHTEQWAKHVVPGQGNAREVIKPYPAIVRYQPEKTN